MIKKYKLVVGKDLQTPANPNRSINNPLTGTPVFATFPALKSTLREFPGGPIYLREGQHFGPNRGHGVHHIWREHFPKAQDLREAEQQVASFVASILVAGAAIHYEGIVGSRENRALVCRHATGVIILEERRDGTGTIYYAVVTAFPKGQARGVLIGAL